VDLELRPLRLRPGADLRKALEEAGQPGAFVVTGIGSLVRATIRLAGHHDASVVPGPLEILTLAGSLSADGAHLHMSVADAEGRVLGGHVSYGNEIRTTAEILLALLPGWALAREPDPATGYDELVVRSRQPK
jgi:predicted DNA-binding protein with PD1-like motif